MRRTKLFWILLLGAGALFFLRRWGLRRGSTNAEVQESLLGDEIIPHPMLQSTHAVTIRTNARRVWPWIVQMGYYRGGWYTDTSWWDYIADRYLRLLVREEAARSGQGHRDEPSADQIISEYQQPKVGDVILDGPPGTAYFTVAALEPNRLLALYSTTHLRYLFPKSIRDNPKYGIGGEFSWVFIVNEINRDETRVFLRTRANVRPVLYRLFIDALFPLADAVYSQKVLTGIKQRAEKGSV